MTAVLFPEILRNYLYFYSLLQTLAEINQELKLKDTQSDYILSIWNVYLYICLSTPASAELGQRQN